MGKGAGGITKQCRRWSWSGSLTRCRYISSWGQSRCTPHLCNRFLLSPRHSCVPDTLGVQTPHCRDPNWPLLTLTLNHESSSSFLCPHSHQSALHTMARLVFLQNSEKGMSCSLKKQTTTLLQTTWPALERHPSASPTHLTSPKPFIYLMLHLRKHRSCEI